MGSVIKIQKLTKYYGQARGVEDLDLEIQEGEIFGFLGPNGAGKTTTMRLLLHLLQPTSGQAFVFGKDVSRQYPEILSEIGYLPGDLRLYERMTGWDLLKFQRSFYKHKALGNYVEELIDWLEVQMDKPFGKLSKGNKQKIGILLSLFHNPGLLILDEPTSGLDPITQNRFYDLLRQLKLHGTTVFLSSHNMAEVQKVCDRVGIIREGHLVEVSTLTELQSQYVKRVEIFFEGEYDLGDFQIPGVEVRESADGVLRLNVSSASIGKLLTVLSRYELQDLNFYTPDLEELFLTYYQ